MANTFQMIVDFQKKTTAGAFPNISRIDVANGLRQRLTRPGAIDQGFASLCGPASFIYCLINWRPDVYVQYVTDLYDGGSGAIGKLVVTPGDGCKRCQPKPNEIPPVDWVALASLRDSENKILAYESVSNEAAGITLPKTLADWFRKAGFSGVQESTQLFGAMCQTADHVRTAGSLKLSGRHVCLLINAQMLGAGVASLSAIPNHWVVLTRPAMLKNRQIAIEVFTWGNAAYRVPQSGTVEIDGFLKNYYGYVAAS